MSEAEQKFINLVRQCIQGALNEGVEPRHIMGAMQWEANQMQVVVVKMAESPIIKPPGR